MRDFSAVDAFDSHPSNCLLLALGRHRPRTYALPRQHRQGPRRIRGPVVELDCELEDQGRVAVWARLAGHIRVGGFLGIGSTVSRGLAIGPGALVGSSAVVQEAPARPLAPQNFGAKKLKAES